MADTPDTGAGTPPDLPTRIVVGKNGAYWRDYGDHYSMCPVSTDNDPVEVAAVYVRSRITAAEQWALDAARSRPAIDPAGLDALDALREVARQVHARHDLGHSLGAWPHACALCETFREFARLSVADGPGPEERA